MAGGGEARAAPAAVGRRQACRGDARRCRGVGAQGGTRAGAKQGTGRRCARRRPGRELQRGSRCATAGKRCTGGRVKKTLRPSESLSRALGRAEPVGPCFTLCWTLRGELPRVAPVARSACVSRHHRRHPVGRGRHGLPLCCTLRPCLPPLGSAREPPTQPTSACSASQARGSCARRGLGTCAKRA